MVLNETPMRLKWMNSIEANMSVRPTCSDAADVRTRVFFHRRRTAEFRGVACSYINCLANPQAVYSSRSLSTRYWLWLCVPISSPLLLLLEVFCRIGVYFGALRFTVPIPVDYDESYQRYLHRQCCAREFYECPAFTQPYISARCSRLAIYT